VLKTPRGWALLDYTGSMTFVNRLRVADCKLIREGDRIQIGAIAVRLSEIRQQEVTEGSPLLA
jgi:pSer/pThr/pTyr-binding forkhead associated (FHA) protein